MSKKNEINVDELINSQGGSKKQETNESKNKNASQTGWDDDEVESGGAGFLGSDTKKDKKKGKKDQKKENSAATWGTGKETEPVEEKVEVPQQPEKKKGIMTKPGTKPVKPDVVVNGFDFPELGQEVAPKEKEETKQEQPKPVVVSGISSNSSAPVRFQNANKKTAGESFAKIEPVAEKEPPKVEQKTVSEQVKAEPQPVIQRGGFRRENNPQTEEKPVVEDTGKIKFGGEGPVRFVKSDKTVSKPKEETKTEAEILREQREREIEEKLQKEREEAQRHAEERKKRDAANPNHKHGDGKPFHKKHDNQHPEEETKQENHKEKQHHSEKKEEKIAENKQETKNENHEHKSPTKFNNSKKNQQGTPKEQPKVEVATPVVNETKEPETQETKEVVTKASTATWGEGLKRKSNKN